MIIQQLTGDAAEGALPDAMEVESPTPQARPRVVCLEHFDVAQEHRLVLLGGDRQRRRSLQFHCAVLGLQAAVYICPLVL